MVVMRVQSFQKNQKQFKENAVESLATGKKWTVQTFSSISGKSLSVASSGPGSAADATESKK